MSRSPSVFYDKKTGNYFTAYDNEMYNHEGTGYAQNKNRYEEIGAYPPYRDDFDYFVDLHKKEQLKLKE